MSEPNNCFIAVRVPARLADDLERCAETEGRSRSDVIRDAVIARVRPADRQATAA